jgi:hypothetical protein
MRIFSITLLLVILSAGPAFAGHAYFQAQFSGTLQTDVDRDGKLERTKVDETFFLANPANFLVVYLDVVPVTVEFQLQEWSDTNVDGIPDTFVSDIAGRYAMSSFANPAGNASKFYVILTPTDTDLDDDGTEDFNGSLACDGGKATTDGSSAVKWSCKLSGPAHDENTSGVGNDSYLKGTLRSKGAELVLP